MQKKKDMIQNTKDLLSKGEKPNVNEFDCKNFNKYDSN